MTDVILIFFCEIVNQIVFKFYDALEGRLKTTSIGKLERCDAMPYGRDEIGEFG